VKPSYDVAVIGLGTMGSFACCELAGRRLRVIGFDQFVPPHGRGSHSGDTRVFRIAYAEHPDYVPLAMRASTLWDEYSELGKTKLLTRCGMLSVGQPEGTFVRGILNSAAIHKLEARQYTAAEIQRNFPAFAVDEAHVGVFEPTAGWIDANAAIETALSLAKQYGATLRLDDSVEQWSRVGDHFEVSSSSGTVAAEKLVITAGAWTTQLLRELCMPIQVQRKVLTWVDPINPALFQPGAFPVFAFGEEFLYGFPAIGKDGVKLAVHLRPGQTVSNPSEPVLEATLDDAVEPLAIVAKLLPRLAGPLPEALQRVMQMKTCLYGMSPDEHFFVDRHPEWPGVVFAAGFSGHGFKFAPAIGESLADMATAGRTKVPLDFLRIGRLAVS
jgi:sarcosine oxidase